MDRLIPILEKQLTTRISHVHAISGGSINQTYKAVTKETTFFIKVNSATKFPHLFEKEAAALLTIEKQGIVSTPTVVQNFLFTTYQLLVLEWIENTNTTPDFWKVFGKQLAQLHHVTQHEFGWKEDNYMGAILQSNKAATKWPSFFIYERLQPLVYQSYQQQLLAIKHVKLFEKLYDKIPTVFNEEPPSLLHGDLWSGNYLCNIRKEPVLIDPAVYFGHRSMDLAMTTLFGGFDTAFYDAYHYYFPLTANYKEQWALANLYPLLIHLLLFGKTYLPSIERTLNDFE